MMMIIIDVIIMRMMMMMMMIIIIIIIIIFMTIVKVCANRSKWSDQLLPAPYYLVIIILVLNLSDIWLRSNIQMVKAFEVWSNKSHQGLLHHGLAQVPTGHTGCHSYNQHWHLIILIMILLAEVPLGDWLFCLNTLLAMLSIGGKTNPMRLILWPSY